MKPIHDEKNSVRMFTILLLLFFCLINIIIINVKCNRRVAKSPSHPPPPIVVWLVLLSWMIRLLYFLCYCPFLDYVWRLVDGRRWDCSGCYCILCIEYWVTARGRVRAQARERGYYGIINFIMDIY